MNLVRLLELSDIAKEYAVEDDNGNKKCQGCDKLSEELKSHCSKCNMMFYCNRVCCARTRLSLIFD